MSSGSQQDEAKMVARDQVHLHHYSQLGMDRDNNRRRLISSRRREVLALALPPGEGGPQDRLMTLRLAGMDFGVYSKVSH